MGDKGIAITPDEATYFLNIAVIGGTLVGLSFVSLAFFLGDLIKRYEHVAFPVFRDRDPGEDYNSIRQLNPVEFATDYELFDGDPFVVFIAFSVAVTWNLFLLPLTLGLTVAWGGTRFTILTVEMLAFLVILFFSFTVRNQKIEELKPYLTRDELAWPYAGAIVLVLYTVATLVVGTTALAALLHRNWSVRLWDHLIVMNGQAAIFTIKIICVLSLLLGTYTTNKDMFIFFKTIASEKMRQRWLHSFCERRYRSLETRVAETISQLPHEIREYHMLNKLWNGGCPGMVWTHAALKEVGSVQDSERWRDFVNQSELAVIWMIDVPKVARWAAKLEVALKECRGSIAKNNVASSGNHMSE